MSATMTKHVRSIHMSRNIAMSKVVAIMSMSLDGDVADRNDGVADVVDWYCTSFFIRK
jgi:hypothetical protein